MAIPTRWPDALRAAIWSVDPDQNRCGRSARWSRSWRATLAPQRFTAVLSGSFAVLALLLAWSACTRDVYAVAQRHAEIGIRMALGAGQGEGERIVLWRGLRIVAVATVSGSPAAYGAARLIASQAFGVRLTRPARPRMRAARRPAPARASATAGQADRHARDDR